MPKTEDAPVSADDLLDDTVLDDIAALEAAVEAADEEEDLSHPILSPEEVRAARDKARDRVLAERKKQATDALVAQEMAKLKGPIGLTTGDAVKDELVTISLDLAEHSDGITINGHKFYHGMTYTLPRHVADTLRDVSWRGHVHQNELDGKGISDRYRLPHDTVVSGTGAVVNAPQRMA